jgi:hypothetical protein
MTELFPQSCETPPSEAPYRRSRFFFDRRDVSLIAIVNDVLDREKGQEYRKRIYYPHFHPHGIKKMAESRGLRIAYAVIHLLESLDAGQQDQRIGALRSLREEVLNASDGPLPRNTARVLIQIMKDMVRARGDENAQMRLAHDFRRTAMGKPRVVRRMLERYHLLEMSESWNQIAFDDHVHDVNTKGRKSATHLIMDAWIKGIKRLRVIYYNYVQAQFASELLEAAQIMGIELRIGIEFSARFRGHYIQLIWVPRGFIDSQSFLCFLTDEPVLQLMEAGRAVSLYRQKQVLEVLDAFNRKHLPKLNAELGISMPPIDAEQFLSFVRPGQTSLLHLAKYIHLSLMPQMQKRLAELRLQWMQRGKEESEAIEAQVAQMNALDFETIMDRYLSPKANPELPDPMKVQDDPDIPALLQLSPRELLGRLVALRSAYRITLNLTDLTPEDVLEILYDAEGVITRLEIFNLKDYVGGKLQYLDEITILQEAINDGNIVTLKRIIQWIIDRVEASRAPDKRDRLDKLNVILHDMNGLRAMYQVSPLKSRIGSDSTGQSPRMHGMGFAVIDTLISRARKAIQKDSNHRLILPIRMNVLRRVSFIPKQAWNGFSNFWSRWLSGFPVLKWLGFQLQSDWIALEQSTRMEHPGNIVTLGGTHEEPGNGLPLQAPEPTEPARGLSWAYLNTLFKNFLKIAIGFIPAWLTFFLRYDWWVLRWGGGPIWFFITGFRNVLQSFLGGGGFRRSHLMTWRDYVSWERIFDSLLFTGFSVPLLDWIVKTVVLQNTFGITTESSPLILYAVMAMANGIYLVSHNAFRGFSKAVMFGNFFRTLLSIPIAVMLNGSLAAVFSLCGIIGGNAILQRWATIISKASSDIVAGLIEGTADRYRNVHVRLSDYQVTFRKILNSFAGLELLHPKDDVTALLRAPESLLTGDAKEFEQIMIIYALDLLYFWYYQPRGRTAMNMFLASLTQEERNIVLAVIRLLKRQREITLMFVDGLIGKNFSAALAFYLNNAVSYVTCMERLIRESRA